MKKNIDLECVIERNASILSVDLDGEIGMMNIDKGKYYGLDEVGTRIWQLIEKPQTLKNIINTLLEEYDVEAETCEEQVIEFIDKINAEEIIITI